MTGVKTDMRFISGFFSVTLDGEYIKPFIGWAVALDEKKKIRIRPKLT